MNYILSNSITFFNKNTVNDIWFFLSQAIHIPKYFACNFWTSSGMAAWNCGDPSAKNLERNCFPTPFENGRRTRTSTTLWKKLNSNYFQKFFQKITLKLFLLKFHKTKTNTNFFPYFQFKNFQIHSTTEKTMSQFQRRWHLRLHDASVKKQISKDLFWIFCCCLISYANLK